MTTPPNAGQEEISDLTRAITARRKAIREDLELAMNLLRRPDALHNWHLEQLQVQAKYGLLTIGMEQQLAWRLIERALARLDE